MSMRRDLRTLSSAFLLEGVGRVPSGERVFRAPEHRLVAGTEVVGFDVDLELETLGGSITERSHALREGMPFAARAQDAAVVCVEHVDEASSVALDLRRALRDFARVVRFDLDDRAALDAVGLRPVVEPRPLD